jgi:hypothetical protein
MVRERATPKPSRTSLETARNRALARLQEGLHIAQARRTVQLERFHLVPPPAGGGTHRAGDYQRDWDWPRVCPQMAASGRAADAEPDGTAARHAGGVSRLPAPTLE